jgi:RNA polymerase sigma factor for flagellar operon FliA
MKKIKKEKVKKHKIKQDPELWKKLDDLRNSVKDFHNSDPYKRVRAQLAELNYPIVIKLADLLHHKYPETDRDDLQGFGSIGLLDAIDKFDPYKDIQFETFATYRIFGSMYDEMRKLDWVPRLTRQRHSKVEKIRDKFISQNGRAPTNEEMMEMVSGSSITEKQKTIDDSIIKMSYSINKLPFEDEEDDFSSMHVDKKPGQIEELERKEFFANKIAPGLNDLETRFVYLVYYEGRSLKEAAQILQIKESRSSSLHEAAIKKLKEIFKEKDELIVR